jgi:hypothetical protein
MSFRLGEAGMVSATLILFEPPCSETGDGPDSLSTYLHFS